MYSFNGAALFFLLFWLELYGAQASILVWISTSGNYCLKKAVASNPVPACPLTNLFEGTCTPRGWILGVQGIF